MDYLVELPGVPVDKHSRLAEMHAGQCKHYMEQTLCVRQSIMQEPMDFMERARGVSANKVAQAELQHKARNMANHEAGIEDHAASQQRADYLDEQLGDPADTHS